MRGLTRKLSSAAVVAAIAVAAVSGLSGCEKEGGIAAAVNSDKVYEQQVTDYVENFRANQELTDATTWAKYLQQNGYTPESLRNDVIEYYAKDLVIQQDAERHDVSVSDEDAQAKVDEQRNYYGYTDDEWKEQLKTLGYSEESYLEYEKQQLLQERLMDKIIEKTDATDEQLVELANSYGQNINNAKCVEVIVLDKDQEDEQAILDGINNGDTTFDVAKEQHSKGDWYDGWDVMETLDSQLTEALADVDVDGMTGIVKGRTYDFIAKVTDKVTVPEGGFTSADQIPEKFREELNDIATVSDRTQQFQDYANDLYDKATKDVTDMPEGLPYDVSVYGISGDDVDAATSLVLDVDDTTTVFGCDIPYDSSKGNSDVPKIDSTWASSDESVVTVDKDGYVRALKEGTATITATQVDDDSKTATIDVTVNALETDDGDSE